MEGSIVGADALHSIDAKRHCCSPGHGVAESVHTRRAVELNRSSSRHTKSRRNDRIVGEMVSLARSIYTD